jgi:hypothetical protein
MRWEVISDFVANLSVGCWVNFTVTLSPGNDIEVMGAIVEMDFANQEVLVRPMGAGSPLRVKFEQLHEGGPAGWHNGFTSGAVLGFMPTASVLGGPVPMLQGTIQTPHLVAFLQEFEASRAWYEILWYWIMRPFRWLNTFLSGDLP